jgi:cell filamentation protein
MAKGDPTLSDPHFDNVHGVLKNLPGFTEQGKLEDFERKKATKAILNLHTHPVKGSFDTAHLRQIHARIFKEIYPWAGEFRQVNISRRGSYPFAQVLFLEKNLADLLDMLAAENRLKNLDASRYPLRAAYYLGELNAIHPFREGNGRTQREFIRELAAQAGYRLNWSRVSREQVYQASIESHNLGRNAALAAVIAAAVEPSQ